MTELTPELIDAAQAEEEALLGQALDQARTQHLFSRVVNLNATLRRQQQDISVLQEALQEQAKAPVVEPSEGEHRLE